MKRKYEGLPITVDTTVWTVDLNRDELMIILDGIRFHRINRAKEKLKHLRARKSKPEGKRTRKYTEYEKRTVLSRKQHPGTDKGRRG